MTLTRAERRAQTRRRPLFRSYRFWIPVGVLIVLLVAGGAAAIVGKQIYDRAMAAKGSLEQAMPLASKAADQVISGDSEGAKATAAQLASLTADAREQTDDDLWKSLEWVPVAGPNLHAVRVAAAVTDDLVQDALTPATGLSLDALKPKDGAIDLAGITAMQDVVAQTATAVNKASKDLESIDRDPLIDQVDTALGKLTGAIDELQPMLGPVQDLLSVVPDALGANGPRNYLLMFQGISEARSLGGNPAVFQLVHAENGRLTVTDAAQSRDFLQARPRPVAPLDPQAVSIYGDKIGRFTPDLTMIPDFPAAVSVMEAWWSDFKDSSFDSVVSLDPVALSYILKATGPVELPTGEVLTDENAAPLLLNDVYFRYEDPLMQNAFFAAAADSIFTTLTSGQFSPIQMMNSLNRAAEEGRLLYLSSSDQERKLIGDSRLTGVMPPDDAERTLLGVYVNDNTGSKKSYYLDMGITACLADGRVQGEVSVESSLTKAIAASLPYQATGPYFDASDISTYVTIYGPPGSVPSNVTIDGAPAQILTSGEHLNRPVFKVELRHHLESTHRLNFTFENVAAATGPLELWHTPMVRETPVTLRDTCTG